jgi:hypothetical protein
MLDSALSGDVASTGDRAGARRTRHYGERRASVFQRTCCSRRGVDLSALINVRAV